MPEIYPVTKPSSGAYKIDKRITINEPLKPVSFDTLGGPDGSLASGVRLDASGT